MQRRPMVLLMLGLLILVPLAASAAALEDDFPGQLCWQLYTAPTPANPNGTPLVDQLRFKFFSLPGTTPPMYHFDVDWTTVGLFYQIQSAGNMTTNSAPPSPNYFAIRFAGAHATAAFGGNKVCGFNATVSASPPFHGSWEVQCAGSTNFSTNGRFVALTGCASPAAVARDGGPMTPASLEFDGQPMAAGFLESE